MEHVSTYKTNVCYFALKSMLRDYANKERCSKRAKKQFDFARSFIDSKDAEYLRKNIKGEDSGKNI